MRRPTWYLVLAILLSSGLTGAVAIVWGRVDRAESDRKFCDLISAQDDAWSETTPTTITGRRVAEAMRKLRQDLDCPAQ
ncbi:hypothetical protein [Actinoplanes palleronii]|uniref:Secreted protein n=1 Tax=Actinoplanes palleronii TaxID=113570 RepID=A0ABQ4B419_9ACTN|nr:hypothetical protein [Actinoplanes palleronii]GIE65414.1 hypothetical protein Apa02nite_015220 [Actinoplanes palleronii]